MYVDLLFLVYDVTDGHRMYVLDDHHHGKCSMPPTIHPLLAAASIAMYVPLSSMYPCHRAAMGPMPRLPSRYSLCIYTY